MKTLKSLPFVWLMGLCVAGGNLMAQAPVLTSVQNPASNIPAGYPNSGLAQGSIIVIYGSNMGPTTLVQPTSLPFPTTAGLAGTTVKVTVNGTTVTAPMVYSYATQVAAILPSNTPLGTGDLAVTFNNSAGTIPITVVASNFGMSTVNQTGIGPAVITTPGYALITTTNSAKPGDNVVLWGTGLGATSGSDASLPVQVDLGTPIQVLVGGIQANILYRGRSASPGLDQINFQVPAGVTGCNVSVGTFTSGSIVSNYTTMPISINGGACPDSTGYIAAYTALLGKSSVRFGLLALEFNDNINGVSGNDVLTAQSGFLGLSQSQFAATSGSLNFGQCNITYASFNLTPQGATSYLNAGSSLTLKYPSGSASLTTQSGQPILYGANLAAEPAGAYTLTNGAGGADVAAFSAGFNLAQPITWTNPSAATTINRSQPLTITWTGGDSNAFADISLYGNGPGNGANLECMVPASLGQYSIPSAMLQALPAASGGITVSTGTYPQVLTVSGMDLFLVVSSRPSVSIVSTIK